jgi:hypothetical protein
MLKLENGQEISAIQALEFLYKSCRNLQASASDHDKLKMAFELAKKTLEEKENDN